MNIENVKAGVISISSQALLNELKQSKTKFFSDIGTGTNRQQ